MNSIAKLRAAWALYDIRKGAWPLQLKLLLHLTGSFKHTRDGIVPGRPVLVGKSEQNSKPGERQIIDRFNIPVRGMCDSVCRVLASRSFRVWGQSVFFVFANIY